MPTAEDAERLGQLLTNGLASAGLHLPAGLAFDGLDVNVRHDATDEAIDFGHAQHVLTKVFAELAKAFERFEPAHARLLSAAWQLQRQMPPQQQAQT